MKEIIDRLDRIVELLERLQKIKEGEKERSPLTPKEKGEETYTNNPPRARACVRFVKPTLEEVAAHVREKGYTFDPEHFWNFYESNGWRVGYRQMRSWRAACVTWQKNSDQLAARTAHIDAKMDERERRRERRASSFARKPADNYIKPTEADLEEVRRDYDF